MPARGILRPLKVATPLTAFMVAVPDRIAPLVPVPGVMDRVTVTLELVTVLPPASWMVTIGCAAKAAPAVAEAGEAVKASLAASPAARAAF